VAELGHLFTSEIEVLSMKVSMAGRTERDQIVVRILTRPAAELLVMYFKVCHHAARLAAPTVAAKYFATERSIEIGI
jgi:hypothetical protein